MASRFNSGSYDPELVKVMGAALDSAWANFDPPPRHESVARTILVNAIIDAVETGVREPGALVQRATMALSAAIKIDPDNLDGEG